MLKWIPLWVLFCTLSLKTGFAQESPTPDPDRAHFFKGQNLIWEELPYQWNEGAFTGNGMLGMVVYFSGEYNGLVFSLGREDVTDHRGNPDGKSSFDVKGTSVIYDFNRLGIGRMILKFSDTVLSGKLVQDLWNAELHATINTSRGEININAFVPRGKDVCIIKVDQDKGGDKKYSWEFLPANAQSPRMMVRPDDVGSRSYELNPLPHIFRKRGFIISEQSLLAGGDYATAWKESAYKNGASSLFVSVANEIPQKKVSVDTAISLLESAQKTGTDRLRKNHRNWWHQYYQKSFLSIPDAKLESFYWIQMYKLATATRRGRTPIDLFGPYYKTSPWPGIWWNLNVQLTYFPVYTGNHLELGENLIHFVDDHFDALLDRLGGKRLGDLSWVLHNYWQQYSFSADTASLIKKWLPKALRLYYAYKEMMIRHRDGSISLAPMLSPEYNGGTKYFDSNYNLANLKWLISKILELDRNGVALTGYAEKLRQVQDHLIDYPVDENGLKIGRDQSLDHSHRHYSHLLAFYPLFLLDPDKEKDRELIRTSLDHWINIEGGKNLTGYSYTGAASMFAALGDGDKAVQYLHFLLETNPGIGQFHTNTFYTEGGGRNMVIETPLSGASSVMDLLLQSRGGKIRIFPAVPADWDNPGFENLLAEGGFIVSAGKEDGKTVWIRIKSQKSAHFIIKNKDLPQLKIIKATGKYVLNKSGRKDEWQISLQVGAQITLKKDSSTYEGARMVLHEKSEQNPFGVKAGKRLKENQDYQVDDFLPELIVK